MTQPKYKSIFVPEDLHSEVKIFASKNHISMIEYMTRIIDNADCSCGEPWTLGVVHRKNNKPCYFPEKPPKSLE